MGIMEKERAMNTDNLEPRVAPSTDLIAAVLEAKAEMAKSPERRVLAIVALFLVLSAATLL